MADLTRTIEIIFAGTDQIGPTVTSIGNKLSSLEGQVGTITSPMADWTKDILAAETAVVGFGLALGGVAINQAGEFKTSVDEIGTLFSGTEEQVKTLGDEILRYAQDSTSSIEQINASVYQAISTGTDYADAVKLVADAEVLATGGRADLSQVTDLLASSMNAYGAEVTQAGDYTDVLFTAVQKGKTSIPELAASLGQVTGIASAAKVPFEDVNAAIAALTITTGNTAESTTKFKALLTELLKPSEDLTSALGGVTLEADGLDGVMAALKAETGGSAEEMTNLFGSTEAVQAALALANDNSGAFASALEAMEKRAGAAARANAELEKSFENINQNLLNNIQAAFVTAGEPLLDGYDDIVGELSNLFKSVSFEFSGGAFDELYDAADGAADTITETLRGIASALPEAMEQVDFDTLLTAFDNLGGSISGLFGDLDLTNPDDLAEAIQVLIDGVSSLTNLTAGAVDGLKPFIQTIAGMIDDFNKSGDGAQNLVGSIFGLATGIDTLLPVMGTLADSLIILGGVKGFAGVSSAVSGIGPLLFNPVTGLIVGFGALVAVAPDIYDLSRGLLGLETSTEAAARRAQEMEQAVKDQQAALDGNTEALARADQQTREIVELKEWAAKSEERIRAEVEASRGSYEDQVATLVALSDAQRKQAERAREAAEAQEQLKTTTLEQVDALDKLSKGEFEMLDVARQNELIEAKRLAVKEGWLGELSNEKDATDALAKSKEELAQAAQNAHEKQLLEMELATQYRTVLAELASAETLKTLELGFELDLAEIEAQRDIALGVFDTLNTAIDSTAQLMGDLWGTLADSDLGFSDKWALQDQIDAEEDRRAKAFEQQQRLTEEQIKQMQAQTELIQERAESMARGDAAITIDGAGLQPHLEAFMWEILRTVQTRVNQDGLDMLLGV
ncbi:phage tail tape measure protein [Marinobacterium litorale]|uniref:phage tail tape measure protein n=1 Tax=Marinobacterium litorale TaxID=404770 RepID=UPI0004297751|nr:phage tail tape measure protein [Marinobacterium litorale]